MFSSCFDSSLIEDTMHTCLVPHCVLHISSLCHTRICLFFKFRWILTSHRTLKPRAGGTELKSVVLSLFILLGQKQIVGSESFPGARFVFVFLSQAGIFSSSHAGVNLPVPARREICYMLDSKEEDSAVRDSKSDAVTSQSAAL